MLPSLRTSQPTRSWASGWGRSSEVEASPALHFSAQGTQWQRALSPPSPHLCADRGFVLGSSSVSCLTRTSSNPVVFISALRGEGSIFPRALPCPPLWLRGLVHPSVSAPHHCSVQPSVEQIVVFFVSLQTNKQV